MAFFFLAAGNPRVDSLFLPGKLLIHIATTLFNFIQPLNLGCLRSWKHCNFQQWRELIPSKRACEGGHILAHFWRVRLWRTVAWLEKEGSVGSRDMVT